MYDINAIIWLFPILFIFHDFEEIIFIKPWVSRNKVYLRKRLPKLPQKIFDHFENITTSAFALAVAEEFIIVSIVTIISYIANWYSLWAGLFVVFALHLIIHCLQALIVKKYVPSIITSVICLPFCIFIIVRITQLLPLLSVVLYTFFCAVIMVANLALVHKGMDKFSQWLKKYEQQPE